MTDKLKKDFYCIFNIRVPNIRHLGLILCTLECSEKGVEPADTSPQAENNVKKTYELNSKRINHCYICKPKVECTYVSCYERHL